MMVKTIRYKKKQIRSMINFFKKLLNFNDEKKNEIVANLIFYGFFINVFLFYIIGFPNNFNEVIIFNLIYFGALEIYSLDKKSILMHLIRLIMSFIGVLFISSTLYIISGSLIVLLFGEYGKSFLKMLYFYKDEQVWTPFFLILESPFRYFFN